MKSINRTEFLLRMALVALWPMVVILNSLVFHNVIIGLLVGTAFFGGSIFMALFINAVLFGDPGSWLLPAFLLTICLTITIFFIVYALILEGPLPSLP